MKKHTFKIQSIVVSLQRKVLHTQHHYNETNIFRLMAIQQRRFITPWLKPNVLFSCSSYANRQQKCLEIVNGFSTKVSTERVSLHFQKELTQFRLYLPVTVILLIRAFFNFFVCEVSYCSN